MDNTSSLPYVELWAFGANQGISYVRTQEDVQAVHNVASIRIGFLVDPPLVSRTFLAGGHFQNFCLTGVVLPPVGWGGNYKPNSKRSPNKQTSS